MYGHSAALLPHAICVSRNRWPYALLAWQCCFPLVPMDPQERRRQIVAELAANRLELEQARKTRRVEKRIWKIKDTFRLLVLALYVVADCDLDPVVWYVRRRAKQFPTWPEKCDDDIKLVILDLVTSASDEELDVTSPLNPARWQIAHDEVVAWRTGTWARNQNELGGTLSTADILCHREDAADELPIAVRPPSWGPVAPRLGDKARKKVFRLRSQFGGYFGCLPLRPNIPQDVLLTKVIIVATLDRSCFALPLGHDP